jgi:hypothetical protein
VESIEGGAGRGGAAEQFEVSVSAAIPWMQRFARFASAPPEPSGGERVACGCACALVSPVDHLASGFNPG